MNKGFPNILHFQCQDQKICDALRDLVPFIQFEKREKHSPMEEYYF